MGQTLTHGVYLPDEGERNCYNGLASNWAILDGAVGTVADHTTALSGKAPLVHTHTKSDITDFPAYGNAAGTICEGNDSRLSDARTPVAHTHGKSDVTDLFNSANTWTDTNTYTVTGDVPIKITNGKDATNPSATEMKDIRFSDVNGKIIGGVRHSLESGGTSKMHLYSRSFSSDGSSNSNHGLLIVNNKQTGVHEVQSESNFIPSANNTYDLGSSSYQWNNLYAKNYYYNGTAWGLDKANTWTENNTFNNPIYLTSSLRANNSAFTSGTPSDNVFYNPLSMGGFVNNIWINSLAINGAVRKNGYNDFSIRVYSQTNNTLTGVVVETNADASDISFRPIANGPHNLGTSSYQWKTLNGINPGALSLPNIEASTNIAGIITDLTGTTQISLASGDIGWVYIQIPNVQGDYIEVQIGNSASIRYFVSAGYSDGLDSIEVLVPKPPVVTKVRVKATGGAVSKALLYSCLGNV